MHGTGLGHVHNFMKTFSRFTLALVAALAWMTPSHAGAKSTELLHVFLEPPACGLRQRPLLPTPNTHILDEDMTGYAARTRTNDEYGLPGWTRSLGSRFHKGVDVVPVAYERSSETVRIEYYDPKSHRSFSCKEAVLIPRDEISSILDGEVVVANRDFKRSGYGRYVMIQHHFADGSPFISMYAHLDRLEVEQGDHVERGRRIGWMGQTSSNPEGRRYLMAIPHCHFEVGRVINPDFASTTAARMLSPPMLGGKYDPRNIQPYSPVAFLKTFHAQAHSATILTKASPLLRDN